MSRVAITPQLMTALFQGFKALFQKGWDAGETFYQEICTIVPSKTSKEIYAWLGQSTGFRKWVGDRVIQALGTHDFTITNEHFENTIGVNKNQIDDDETGTLSTVFEQLGRDAKEHPDEVVFELLKTGRVAKCYDGKPFFASDHPVSNKLGKITAVSNLTTEAGNKPTWYVFDTTKVVKPMIWQKRKDYDFVRLDQATDSIVFQKNEALYGADARVAAGFGLWQLAHACDKDLTADNFKAVRAAMRGLKGDNGRPLRVRPTVIMVGTSQESAAESIFLVKTLANGGDNPLYNQVKVIVNPFLD
ncbi:Mu-like prophage major head subunit gpT family protein [Hydrocarboniphaga effusa]|uniref:Mu-like prophage major head subunit gpT family protein n=1 Tax=Hydrocarboniphaga effusa TaxID=243629 RepID=UPI003BA9268D